MENTHSSASSRSKFFAFITIGLLVAAATGVLVWKTSTPTSSSADAGPLIVSKTPNVVNASEEAATSSSQHSEESSSASATAKRSTSRQALQRQHGNDPLLPPNAFMAPQDTAVNYGGNNAGTGAAPATGIQETSAAEQVVSETDAATQVLASPASSRTRTPARTQEATTPRFTPTPTSESNTPVEPTPAPAEEPTEQPIAPITTIEPQDGAPAPESSAPVTSDGSPTDVIIDSGAPLLPEADETTEPAEASLEPAA